MNKKNNASNIAPADLASARKVRNGKARQPVELPVVGGDAPETGGLQTRSGRHLWLASSNSSPDRNDRGDVPAGCDPFGNQTVKVGISVPDAIDRYTPSVDGSIIETVTRFVKPVVTDAGVDSAERARSWLTALSHLAQWAHAAGYALEREVVLQPAVIAEYCRSGVSGRSVKSRGTIRSTLMLISSELGIVPDGDLIGTVGRGETKEPYTKRELTQLVSWAQNLRTAYQSVNAQVLLACTLGAGLTPREVGQLRAKHVLVDDAGVVLEVPVADTARRVPVLAEWESVLGGCQMVCVRGWFPY